MISDYPDIRLVQYRNGHKCWYHVKSDMGIRGPEAGNIFFAIGLKLPMSEI